MTRILAIRVNDQVALEYDRHLGLPGKVRALLDSMDRDMDAGVTLDDVAISAPTTIQRAHFVTGELLRALRAGNEDAAWILCGYLANRLPDLEAVAILESGDSVSAELLFETSAAD